MRPPASSGPGVGSGWAAADDDAASAARPRMTAARNRNIPIRYTFMRTILFAGAVLLVSSGSLLVRTAPAAAPLAAPVEDALRAFWEADSPNEAEKRAAKVVAAGG